MAGHQVLIFKPSTLFTPSYHDGYDVTNTNHALRQMNNGMYRAVLPITLFVGIEAVIGFLGNAIVLYVFLFRYKPCNFRYFVLCLAFIDILSTLTTIPGEIVTQVNWYMYPNKYLCKAKSFFNVFTVSGEALCLLTIAVDRYRKVCHPHKWQIQPRHAKILGFANIGVAFVIALPVAFLWGVRSHEHRYTYRGSYVIVKTTICEKDQKFEDSDWPLGYSISAQVLCSICLIALLSLYVLIARHLVKNTIFKRRDVKQQTALRYTVSNDSLSRVETRKYQRETNDDPVREQLWKIKSSLMNCKGWFKKKVTIQTRQSANCVSNLSLRDENLEEMRNGRSCSSMNVAVGMQNHTVHTRDENEREAVTTDISNHKPSATTIRESVRAVDVNKHSGSAFRRRTLIMFILTLVFIITTTIYLTLLSVIARTDDILLSMSDSNKAWYFFFLRLVFINHVINPVVYGLLDPQFRNIMKAKKRSTI